MAGPFKSQEEWNEWYIRQGHTPAERETRRRDIQTIAVRKAHDEALQQQANAEKARMLFIELANRIDPRGFNVWPNWGDINRAIDSTVEAVKQGRVEF